MPVLYLMMSVSAPPLQVSPNTEALRLAAVRRYDILDTPADGSFDRITAIAANLFSAPISIISLVDHDRIWFKSHHGLEVEQVERSPGLCASAIFHSQPWLLTDAKTDIRSLTNPLVAGDFGLRFYLGIPLRTHDGFNLGTLCVIDHTPRTVTDQQTADLTGLASIVMDQMELRLSARRAVTDLKLVIKQKDAALQRSVLMAKEVDHRVMNSLQLTAGLLYVQHGTLGNSQAAEQVALAAARVSAIARVHRHIYMNENVETTDCKVYLEGLCKELSETLHQESLPPIVLEAIEAPISTQRIVPVGLIVAELVINAAKHGEGAIIVSFKRSASGGFSLSVSDEGRGLPANYDPAKAGLGTKIITAMGEQLGGRLLAGPVEGSGRFGFTLLFPE